MPTSTDSYREAESRFWSEAAGRQPDERTIHLPSIDAEVRVLEYGDGPPLLFVHGGPNAGSTWAPLVARLSVYRCMIVDRPGAGLSTPAGHAPKKVREDVAAVVAAILEEIEPKPVALVGSSFGSYSVLSYAIAHPNAPLASLPMVHYGCPALVPGCKVPLRFILQSIPGFRSLLIALERPTTEVARKNLGMIGHRKSIEAGKIPDVWFEWYAALLGHTRTRENELALYGRIRPRDNITMDELRGLHQPMTFFWGESDSFGGRDVAESVAAAIPDAELELLPDAGHLPWMDAPDAAARHAEEFLAKTLGS